MKMLKFPKPIRLLAMWLFSSNIPLPGWFVPHLLAIGLGTKSYGRVRNDFIERDGS